MKTSNRIVSVDIFRGLTVAAMILVNNPGSWGHVYSPLLHAEWHGLTPTDLIFPFFLFIVGMSITLAYTRRKKEGIDSAVYKKIVSRTCKLIILGLILAAFTVHFPFVKTFSDLRLPGVLQRIGLVFFVASILFLNINWKGLLVIFIGILIGYWYVMTQIPVNGGLPMLTEESNLATVIDTNILTRSHMWKVYDPEGILSTVPAIATSIFGMLFGKVLINNHKSSNEKLVFFVVIGTVALILGYIFSLNFPLNKSLWTSSFVLVTGGWACLIYALIFYMTDVLKKDKWGVPAIIFGSNAITVFFLSGLIGRLFGMIEIKDNVSVHSFLYNNLSSIITNLKLSSLIYAMGVIAFYYLVALILYKRKIFIKV
ncbi:DUF5009 domain-containing protein [Yeosuana aromativorans]|uniref:DUF5009 domain-containing protein n=1 Tax=Yeosuana aromativorans TaxID=288019 RepID=A0A8J3BE72_9FLAO|nr:heparan-alpha-glucosaminide N-acetyltransferase domain-containing protein [Yeosuana aromativorans]GGK14966.1 DUF5009 domain-containing protein [Yeosuana aromativorans]